MFIDLPLEELQQYYPSRHESPDFDSFWADTLAETRKFPLNAIFTPVEVGFRTVEVFDVTYNGYGGQPIKGWFILPRHRTEPLPCVVEYLGYGGGRGLAIECLHWASVGYAHFVMDTRGQGTAWRKGDTPDPEPDGGNPHFPGFMTRGILNYNTYYYRRVFTDAIRAVEAARTHPAVNKDHIAVTGSSQGGGIALAVAGLEPTIEATMPDVPFLCHYRKATEITDSHPYNEIVRFCKIHRDHIETVFHTLNYFDGVNFAPRAQAQALFSVALMDEICPPRTVFAAYNHYAGPKQIRIWHYNTHEGGEAFQTLEKMKFLAKLWG